MCCKYNVKTTIINDDRVKRAVVIILVIRGGYGYVKPLKVQHQYEHHAGCSFVF